MRFVRRKREPDREDAAGPNLAFDLDSPAVPSDASTRIAVKHFRSLEHMLYHGKHIAVRTIGASKRAVHSAMAICARLVAERR
jgi:hypothetical protein